jgi:hypothetical protein
LYGKLRQNKEKKVAKIVAIKKSNLTRTLAVSRLDISSKYVIANQKPRVNVKSAKYIFTLFL